MKYLKYLILFFSLVLSLPLITAFFIDNDYTVEKHIVINEEKQTVFDYLKLLKNQEKFGLWAGIDTNTIYTYTGTDGAVGFVAAWESTHEQVGKGRQEILSISENERIDYAIHFNKSESSDDRLYFTTEAVNENKTKVVWGFTSSIPYPMNFILLLVDFETLVGNDLQEGLANLKVILEKQ